MKRVLTKKHLGCSVKIQTYEETSTGDWLIDTKNGVVVEKEALQGLHMKKYLALQISETQYCVFVELKEKQK